MERKLNKQFFKMLSDLYVIFVWGVIFMLSFKPFCVLPEKSHVIATLCIMFYFFPIRFLIFGRKESTHKVRWFCLMCALITGVLAVSYLYPSSLWLTLLLWSMLACGAIFIFKNIRIIIELIKSKDNSESGMVVSMFFLIYMLLIIAIFRNSLDYIFLLIEKLLS